LHNNYRFTLSCDKHNKTYEAKEAKNRSNTATADKEKDSCTVYCTLLTFESYRIAFIATIAVIADV